MGCGSCVDKLAKKLMERHRIDMVRAYELAEKAVERVENRDSPNIENALIKSGNPTDYTQACNSSVPNGTCRLGTTCTSVSVCRQGFTCPTPSPICPDPLPNSHLVDNTCAYTKSGCVCAYIDSTRTCDGSPSCVKSGLCNYDCDEGYVWNPVTLACELPAVGVASKRLLVGVGL